MSSKDHLTLIKAIFNTRQINTDENIRVLSEKLLEHVILSDHKPCLCGTEYISTRKDRKTTSYRVRRYIKEIFPNACDALIDRTGGSIIGNQFDYNPKHFSIIKGQDIVKAYRDSFGKSSCMTTALHSNKIQFYAENDNVSLLIFDDGQNKGRCLLWKLESGETVSDRIYPFDPYTTTVFKRYLHENGIHPQPQINNYPNHNFTSKSYYISTKKSTTNRYPYLDTFCWAYFKDDDVILSNDINGLIDYTGIKSNYPTSFYPYKLIRYTDGIPR